MEDDRLQALRERIAGFPKSPGVYLMKDAEGRVLYVGKAKDLRARVNSYFQPGADLLSSRGPDICRMAAKVADVDYLECDSEVDALLKEARLIKDIRPPHNAQLKDDKTFPYIEITTGDDFPAVYVTRRPRLSGSKLYGPFPSATAARDAVNALQRVFKFRTCELEILDGDDTRRFFRPCLLHAINQCTAPCADLISRDEYRKDIDRFKKFMASKRSVLLRQLRREMNEAAKALRFEEAVKLRDRIRAIQSLELSGDVREDVQPEVFYVDPRAGLEKLAELLGLESPPRSMECIDIAHLQGAEMVGSLICFIDGRPFKPGYRRFRIRGVSGIDDYAAIREVIRRRYRHAAEGEELYPDLILIDGGLGQLHAGLEAFRTIGAADSGGDQRRAVDASPRGFQQPPADFRPPGPQQRAADFSPRGPANDKDFSEEEAKSQRAQNHKDTLDASHKGQAPARRRKEDKVQYIPCDEDGYTASDAPAFGDNGPLAPIQPPMVISLAKREEELYIQARSAPVRLARNNPALRLLQQMRDEAHRFAQHYHHILRKKATFDRDVTEGRRPPRRKA